MYDTDRSQFHSATCSHTLLKNHTNMAWDECILCTEAFSYDTSPTDNKTPIQGIACSHCYCRLCIITLHIKQSEDSAKKKINIVCPECRKKSFRIDNLIPNRLFCEALAAIRVSSQEQIMTAGNTSGTSAHESTVAQKSPPRAGSIKDESVCSLRSNAVNSNAEDDRPHDFKQEDETIHTSYFAARATANIESVRGDNGNMLGQVLANNARQCIQVRNERCEVSREGNDPGESFNDAFTPSRSARKRRAINGQGEDYLRNQVDKSASRKLHVEKQSNGEQKEEQSVTTILEEGMQRHGNSEVSVMTGETIDAGVFTEETVSNVSPRRKHTSINWLLNEQGEGSSYWQNRDSESVSRTVTPQSIKDEKRKEEKDRISTSRRRTIARDKGLSSASPLGIFSGYALFSTQMTSKILRDRPNAYQIEVIREIAKIWLNMSDAEKEYYNEVATEAKGECGSQDERTAGAYKPLLIFERLGGDGGPWGRVASHEKNSLERDKKRLSKGHKKTLTSETAKQKRALSTSGPTATKPRIKTKRISCDSNDDLTTPSKRKKKHTVNEQEEHPEEEEEERTIGYEEFAGRFKELRAAAQQKRSSDSNDDHTTVNKRKKKHTVNEPEEHPEEERIIGYENFAGRVKELRAFAQQKRKRIPIAEGKHPDKNLQTSIASKRMKIQKVVTSTSNNAATIKQHNKNKEYEVIVVE